MLYKVIHYGKLGFIVEPSIYFMQTELSIFCQKMLKESLFIKKKKDKLQREKEFAETVFLNEMLFGILATTKM